MPVRIVKDNPDEVISDNIIDNLDNDNRGSGGGGLGLGLGLVGGLVGLGVLAVGAVKLFGGKKQKSTSQQKYSNSQSYQNQSTKTSSETKVYQKQVSDSYSEQSLNSNTVNALHSEKNTTETLSNQTQISFNDFQKQQESENSIAGFLDNTVSNSVINEKNTHIKNEETVQLAVENTEQIPTKSESLENVFQERFLAATMCVSMWAYTCGADGRFEGAESKAFDTLLIQIVTHLFPPQVANSEQVKTELTAFLSNPIDYMQIVSFCKEQNEFTMRLIEQMCWLSASDLVPHISEKQFITRFATDTNIGISELSEIFTKYNLN